MRDTEALGGAPARDAPVAFSADAAHLLRTTQQIQYQLSQMADQKASMLLGITFVIFTISVSQAHQMVSPAPLYVLAGGAFVAALLAVSAVLPSVKVPPRPEGPANILFFGSFSQLPEDEYVSRLMSIVGDTQTIYETFARDIYQNGRILSRKKYRLLGWAYRVLLLSLILSFATFAATVGARFI